MFPRPRLALLPGLMAVATLAFGAGPDLRVVERLIVEHTNQFRRGEGVDKVEVDGKLERAARAFALYMADNDRFSHEADGRNLSQRVTHQGYEYCLVAENLAYQYSSADFGTAELAARYFEGWRKSPGHRANMLESSARDTAVAVVRSARTRRFFAVQLFGRPRSAGCKRAN